MYSENEKHSAVTGFDCAILGQVSFEQCLAHAQQKRGVPQCGFGIPTLKAIIENLTRTDPSLDALRATNPLTFRVTQLTNPCPRDVVLSAVQVVEYVTPQSSYYLARGQLAHALRAAYEPATAQNAPRLTLTVELIADVAGIGLVEVEVVVTGQEDSTYFWPGINPDEALKTGDEQHPLTTTSASDQMPQLTAATSATLFDYKSTALLPSSPHFEHIAQVNLYNLLRHYNGLPVADRLAIDYFSMAGEKIFEVPVWTNAEIEAYMVEKLTPIVESLLAAQPTATTPTNDSNNSPTTPRDSSEDLEAWLPARLDPITDKARGWKCRYCNHAAFCWPDGVPGAAALAGAKQAASGAARRSYFANLNSLNKQAAR